MKNNKNGWRKTRMNLYKLLEESIMIHKICKDIAEILRAKIYDVIYKHFPIRSRLQFCFLIYLVRRRNARALAVCTINFTTRFHQYFIRFSIVAKKINHMNASL